MDMLSGLVTGLGTSETHGNLVQRKKSDNAI